MGQMELAEKLSHLGEVEEIGFDALYEDKKTKEPLDAYIVVIKGYNPTSGNFTKVGEILKPIYEAYPKVHRLIMDEGILDMVLYR